MGAAAAKSQNHALSDRLFVATNFVPVFKYCYSDSRNL
jgi:hypothetical protein